MKTKIILALMVLLPLCTIGQDITGEIPDTSQKIKMEVATNDLCLRVVTCSEKGWTLNSRDGEDETIGYTRSGGFETGGVHYRYDITYSTPSYCVLEVEADGISFIEEHWDAFCASFGN